MTYLSFQSSDDFRKFVIQSTPEQFRVAMPTLSIPEWVASLSLLQTEDALHPKEKLVSLFESIESAAAWDLVGKQLTLQQFLDVLIILTAHPSFQNRLSSLLIGLQPQVFSAALNFFQASHLALFKDKDLLEPLQYHLTQFVHQGEALYEQTTHELEQFENTHFKADAQELSVESLDHLIAQIDFLRNQLLRFLEAVSAALSIAWNTERIDLIEKLSNLNEALQRLLTLFVGHPGSENLPASGIYQNIEKWLSTIYDSSLKDDDASIEGLTRLSVWHLKDYWELGLLPDIHQLNELEHDEADPENKHVNHQRLFSLVQKQLENLHIGSVGDLKRKFVFSKPLLKAYIDRNRHLLS